MKNSEFKKLKYIESLLSSRCKIKFYKEYKTEGLPGSAIIVLFKELRGIYENREIFLCLKVDLMNNNIKFTKLINNKKIYYLDIIKSKKCGSFVFREEKFPEETLKRLGIK